jgi:hypothetical protein
MASRSTDRSVYAGLKDRRTRLELSLRRLGGVSVNRVSPETDATSTGVQIGRLSGVVRVRHTPYELRLWEEFRYWDEPPALYAFQYSLGYPGADPSFRYECHPDVEDPDAAPVGGTISTFWINQYTHLPHFHPKGLDFPIDHLHYMFHRSERQQIIFSLIGWLEVDLVTRFYESGRVPSV